MSHVLHTILAAASASGCKQARATRSVFAKELTLTAHWQKQKKFYILHQTSYFDECRLHPPHPPLRGYYLSESKKQKNPKLALFCEFFAAICPFRALAAIASILAPMAQKPMNIDFPMGYGGMEAKIRKKKF